MKNFIDTKLIIILLAYLFFNCGGEEEVNKTNILQIGDAEYATEDGGILFYGEWDGIGSSYEGNYMELGISADGVQIENFNFGGDLQFAGTGVIIYFTLYSATTDVIALGTYPISAESKPGNLIDVTYSPDWDGEDTTSSFVELVSGELEVINNGSQYELIFNGLDENNETVFLSYVGEIFFFDNSPE